MAFMNEIIEIKVLDNYQIWMKFQDGTSKTVDFLPFIGKGFTVDLLDPSYFAKVEIESGGGLSWPNGYDFCPNFLKEYDAKGEALSAA